LPSLDDENWSGEKQAGLYLNQKNLCDGLLDQFSGPATPTWVNEIILSPNKLDHIYLFVWFDNIKSARLEEIFLPSVVLIPID
jgi:hypothetical protein